MNASGRTRGDEFRDRVILALHEAGFTEARRLRGRGIKPSAQLHDDPGDVDGLHWSLTVRCDRGRDLSGALALAGASAETSGNRYFASIHSRPSYPTERSYVVMTLETFSAVLEATKT